MVYELVEYVLKYLIVLTADAFLSSLLFRIRCNVKRQKYEVCLSNSLVSADVYEKRREYLHV